MTRHHLVVLWPTYLGLILKGAKRMECRLSRHRCPPFGWVKRGDWLWLKQSSGPIRGVARAGRVATLTLPGPHALQAVRTQYGHMICADSAFWDQRSDCRFCTLIWLEHAAQTDCLSVRPET